MSSSLVTVYFNFAFMNIMKKHSSSQVL